MKLSGISNLLNLLLRMTDVNSKLGYFSPHDAPHINHYGRVISTNFVFVYYLIVGSPRSRPGDMDSKTSR